MASLGDAAPFCCCWWWCSSRAVAAAADMAGDRAALLALRDALRLPGKSLRGAVPVGTVGNLTALRTLSLRTNAISGGIPADIGGCVQLRSLNLSGNRLAGRGLFSLALLEKVDLSGNRLTGGVSPEFSRLASLTTLNLDRNGFDGTLPGNLTLPKLARFNVSYNGQLGGAVPASLAGMPASAFLGTSLCGAPLAPGAVPVGTVGNLTALRTLSLRTNAISGRLPEGLFSLALLEKVDLSGNRLTGGVSPEFSRLASLTTLNLDRNGFNGTLPGNLMLPKLAQFNVSYNGQLGGAVPASLTGMPASAFLGTALCGGPLAPCANPSPPSPGGSKGVREEEEDRRERCHEKCNCRMRPEETQSCRAKFQNRLAAFNRHHMN
uniref:Leucine-rich repeat-containing N-terminal plant-type domain-containing protein n=1 Tax=Oryza barthii TaxID=65489 RepID=A0A0D3GDD2_9ORYZ